MKYTLLLWLFVAVFSSLLPAQSQYYHALLQTPLSPACIEIQEESFISWGSIDDKIELEQLNQNQDGYFTFRFDNISSNDHINIRFEEKGDDMVYYQFQFSNDVIILQDHTSTVQTLATNTNKLQNIFRLERCGGKIIWYEQDTKPLFSIGGTGEELVAIVEPIIADDVSIHVTFEAGATICNRCSFVGGTTLYPGDLMFAAYDNYLNISPEGFQASEIDLIQIRTQVAIQTGTTFLLTEGTYETNNNYWYAGNGRADETIASQQITYTGENSIPKDKIICFNLPDFGAGNTFLAKNFFIDGENRSNDFCVKNVGNTNNPKINLSTNDAAAIFLQQGTWQFQNDHGIFCGRVLSGLQYGGAWIDNSNDLPATSRLSQIPSDISCIYLEDDFIPSGTERYATISNNPSGGTYIADLNYIIDFGSNWTINTNFNQDLSCTNSTLVNNDPSLRQMKVYPNPYCDAFFVEIELENASNISLEIWDMNGRLQKQPITHQWLQKGKHQFKISHSTSSATSNMHLVRMINPQGVLVEKVLQHCSEKDQPSFISPKGF